MSVQESRVQLCAALCFILAAFGLLLSGCSRCQDAPLPTIRWRSESIVNFAGKADYTIDDLVLKAVDHVSEKMKGQASAHVQFMVAGLICTGHECVMDHMTVEITAFRQVGCFSLDGTATIGYDKLVSFLFDAKHDTVDVDSSAIHRYSDTLPTSWNTSPIRWQDALRIAIERYGDQFAKQYPRYALSIANMDDLWHISFSSDLSGALMPEIDLSVDVNTGMVTRNR